jgi:ATP-dependent helicase/nuclease subunit B
MSEIVLHATGYGRQAAEALHARITAAKRGDPLAPVTVVVPTNYVGVSVRRLLAGGALGPVADRGDGIAGLTLLTVYRLAELLGAPRLAAQGRRPVSTPILGAAVRAVLADEPGLFADVAAHPATAEALVEAHRELSDLDDAALDTLAAASHRAGEVVRVHRAVRDRLRAGWYEEADLMAAARQALAEGAPVAAGLGTVIVYLPQDLARPAAALFNAVAEHTSVEVIAARTGAANADAEVDRSLRRLGLDPTGDAAPDAPIATRVISVSDAEEEIRSGVQCILDAAREGMPLERMALLYPTPEPYARIAGEQLAAAGIPANGRAVRPLVDRLAGRWLLDLLALPDRRYARPAVMALLAAAPDPVIDNTRVPTGAWERLSRDAGIVRDRRQWHDKLTRLAADLRRRADEEEHDSDDPRDWLVDRLRRDADRAEQLCAFAARLFDDLATAQATTSWADLAAWCTAMLARHLGDERARERWPEAERTAAERVEVALDRRADLDAVAGPCDLRSFRHTLELDADLGRACEFGQGPSWRWL